jgi:hypothetical protein
LQIGMAILVKRRVICEIYGGFLAPRFAVQPHALCELRRRDLEQFQLTSRIIRDWTPALVVEDWAAYCAASRKAREGLSEIIAAERKLLYPLLGARCRGECETLAK